MKWLMLITLMLSSTLYASSEMKGADGMCPKLDNTKRFLDETATQTKQPVKSTKERGK